MSRPEECSNCKYWEAETTSHGTCNALAVRYYGRDKAIGYQSDRERPQDKFVTRRSFCCNHYREATSPPITTCPVCGKEGTYLGTSFTGIKRYNCFTPSSVCPVTEFLEREEDDV